MNKLITGLLLASSIGAGAALAQPISKEDGEKFFERYLALDAAYDPAFIELYADETRIRSLRRYPSGQERMLELNGVQWKSALLNALSIAKLRGDRSEYKNPRYELVGEKLRIRADRYSILKCYWDKGFSLTLGRRQNGSFFIEEQYFETQPESNC